MERYFGRSLDRVRVFSGLEARDGAQARGADAFTYGQDIHLGAGGQALTGMRRNALLAHEVVHTLQQRHASAGPQVSGLPHEPQGTAEEQHADTLARGFALHESGHAVAGRGIRDRVQLRTATHATVQLARHATHYGEFEDHQYNDVLDGSGTAIGVQMYLKFHPGNNVDATQIGLTQAAEGRLDGSQIGSATPGLMPWQRQFYGRRQATTGAGAGYFIDRAPGAGPSPMYGSASAATPGATANTLGAHAAPGITALTAAQATALPFTGVGYGGGSRFGFRFTRAGVLQGPQPAELHDASMLPNRNSSEQVFETAALALEGNMAGTYLGSVEWGWRRDALGGFSRVPVSVRSRGVPTVNFLTAASIWNPARENHGRMANAAPTNILRADLTVAFTVPQSTPLRERASAVHAGATYHAVEVLDGTGRVGVVLGSDTLVGDHGRDTVDLPEPEIHTVNTAGVLDGEHRCSTSDPDVPIGTRVQLLGPFGGLAGWVRVQVADGPLTGRRGVIRQARLTREALGRP